MDCLKQRAARPFDVPSSAEWPASLPEPNGRACNRPLGAVSGPPGVVDWHYSGYPSPDPITGSGTKLENSWNRGAAL
jgi:hypothetical protein